MKKAKKTLTYNYFCDKNFYSKIKHKNFFLSKHPINL
jgi:hypothetical protein